MMSIPDWVPDATFYQIFPDRFANGNPENDPANVQPWGSPPTRWHYQGGDLAGITAHLDYLQDLGITALYLNPIFHSTANHRYHIIDYFKIDPFLGELTDFQTLVKELHRRDMRIILDGVLNHCGRGFFAFDDVLENGPHSPYLDWFHINGFPLDAFGRGPARKYSAWWNIKDLPKFNTDNPAVRRYLFDMTRYWLDQGIDGWRLDVPNEIDDDGFWAEYRALVEHANPEAYLTGEIWLVDPKWVDEQHFHGQMNYPLRLAILNELSADMSGEPGGEAPGGGAPKMGLRAHLQAAQKTFALPTRMAMYNLLGSHDTRRVHTVLRSQRPKLLLAYAAMFAMPGAPAIYYGDEIGLRGGNEPASRGAFPWDETQWDHELRHWIKTLIGLRKQSAALRRGELRLLPSKDESLLAFERVHQGDCMVVLLNFSGQSQTYKVNKGHYHDLFSGQHYAANQSINLTPWGTAWLQADKHQNREEI